MPTKGDGPNVVHLHIPISVAVRASVTELLALLDPLLDGEVVHFESRLPGTIASRNSVALLRVGAVILAPPCQFGLPIGCVVGTDARPL